MFGQSLDVIPQRMSNWTLFWSLSGHCKNTDRDPAINMEAVVLWTLINTMINNVNKQQSSSDDLACIVC